MTSISDSMPYFQSLFTEHKNQLPGNHLPWLQKKREEAIQTFVKTGFPTNKHEEWRYTPMTLLNQTLWQIDRFNKKDCQWRVIADTAILSLTYSRKSPTDSIDYTPAHSLPIQQSAEELADFYASDSRYEFIANECIITDMQTAFEKYPDYLEKYLNKSPLTDFDAFNTAFFDQGFFILIKKNAHLKQPIWIEAPALLDKHMSCSRHLIILEEGAQATIVESFQHALTSDEKTIVFHNTITEVYVDTHAKLTHYRAQDEHHTNSQSIYLNQLYIKQQAHSETNNFVMSTGAQWIRSDSHIRLEEEHAHCSLKGITIGTEKQYIDHHTTVEHLKPNGTSNEYYKSILSGSSKSVFNGKVIVSPKAIHTNAAQKHKTLLLSREAQMNTKPQLEIFSDDVKCTHGATIGQLDEDALFYLQARGIFHTDAQKLLIEAFLGDLLEDDMLKPIKNSIQQKIENLNHACF